MWKNTFLSHLSLTNEKKPAVLDTYWRTGDNAIACFLELRF